MENGVQQEDAAPSTTVLTFRENSQNSTHDEQAMDVEEEPPLAVSLFVTNLLFIMLF